jgi:cytoskeleton protein RodZ
MADFKELGSFLRQQREEKKISLEEVSMATKVNTKVLQAIEDGDEDRLPPKPFVRGFLQAYARYLGLDPKEILERYTAIIGASQPKTFAIADSEKKIERSLPGGARNIITGFLIILTIIAIVAIQRVIAKREADMHGDVQAVTGNDQPLKIQLSSPSPSAASSPSNNEAAALGGSVTATATPEAATSAAAPVTEKAKKVEPTPEPKPTATPEPTATPKPRPTPTAEPTAKPTPEPKPTEIPEAVPQEIIVEALDKVTITVTLDNKESEDIEMNADQIQTFKAKGKIKLSTPNGGAISIIHNGYDVGVPGNLGQPKTMVFPK